MLALAAARRWPTISNRPNETEEGLIDRAIANGDEHVIKFTEACLTGTPSPLAGLPAAADHVTGIIRRR